MCMDPSSKKTEARRLRTETKLSLKKISEELGVAKSTLSLWLRDLPLDPEESMQRQTLAGRLAALANKKPAPEHSKYFRMSNGFHNSEHKGRVTEAAIAFRLAVTGCRFYTSPFDGDYVDFLVERNDGSFIRLQARSVKRKRSGNPVVMLHRYIGFQRKRKMLPSECDILVGYDLITDNAYVFSFPSTLTKNCVSVGDSSLERWELVTGVEPV